MRSQRETERRVSRFNNDLAPILAAFYPRDASTNAATFDRVQSHPPPPDAVRGIVSGSPVDLRREYTRGR